MDTNEYLTAINAPGVGHVAVKWESEVKPAAAWRRHTLVKTTQAVVMTGAEYKSLAVNSEVETGELPWGTWSNYPYIITHKGQDYFRLYVVGGTIKTTYTVDGFDVERDVFRSYLTPSQREAKRPNGGCITVKASNLRLVGDPALATR